MYPKIYATIQVLMRKYIYKHELKHIENTHTNSFKELPSLGATEDVGIFMHGKQSTLLSSALEKSKTINATKAVTCRKKSNRTAKASIHGKRKQKERNQYVKVEV